MKTTCCSSMALILVSLSMFAYQVIAHDDAPPPSTLGGGFIDVEKCWESLKSIEGCVVEINRSILAGKIHSVGPACCKAFVEVDEACWPKMFPLDPFFPPLAKSYCAAQVAPVAAPVASAIASASDPPATPQTADGIDLSFPGLLPSEGFTLTETNKCEASLQILQLCALEIAQSLLGGEILPMGPGCCKTVGAVDDACWPKMFPFYPFYRPVIKSYCAIKGGDAAADATAPSPTPAV